MTKNKNTKQSLLFYKGFLPIARETHRKQIDAIDYLLKIIQEAEESNNETAILEALAQADNYSTAITLAAHGGQDNCKDRMN